MKMLPVPASPAPPAPPASPWTMKFAWHYQSTTKARSGVLDGRLPKICTRSTSASCIPLLPSPLSPLLLLQADSAASENVYLEYALSNRNGKHLGQLGKFLLSRILCVPRRQEFRMHRSPFLAVSRASVTGGHLDIKQQMLAGNRRSLQSC